MEQKNNDITLIVVDAVSPNIEDDKEIVLPRIQRLIDEGIPKLKDAGLNIKIYEFFLGESKLNHGGTKIERDYLGIDYKIDSAPYELILVGGTLGNKHYNAFIAEQNQTTPPEGEETPPKEGLDVQA